MGYGPAGSEYPSEHRTHRSLVHPGFGGRHFDFRPRQTAVRHWRLIALVLGVYALGLIVTAPATLIDVGLRQASEGRLRLADARGTLWSGSGQVEVRDANRRTGTAKEVAWRVRATSLLGGHLLYEVTPVRAAKHFPMTISPSRIELADADLTLPAAALG